MPWPKNIQRQFDLIPSQPSEVDFHGPYNKLLNHLFPPDSEFTVIPRSHFTITASKRKPSPETGAQPQLQFMLFEVQYDNLPVLLVLVTSPTVVESPLAREMADAQMRSQMTALAELCPLSNLRGISAFGPHLCFYSCDANAPNPEIYPTAVLRESETGLEDVAPRDRWSSTLFTTEGDTTFCKLIDNVKAECAGVGKES